MSESEKQAEEKKKSPLGVIIVIFALIAVILGIGVANNIKKKADNTATAQTSEGKIDSDNGIEAPIAQATIEGGADVNFDLEKASAPRILGDPKSAVRISEHSSFTCGHCAEFHKTNFKKLKADYVDTGKAYIVFNDFPLNAYDIKIGAVARCVPESDYFNFVQLLFETQKSWLKEDFIKYVKQNAKLIGTSEEQADACLNSEELQTAIAEGRDAAQSQHEVSSTPTLVINDKVVIAGLSSYEELKAVIDAELAATANAEQDKVIDPDAIATEATVPTTDSATEENSDTVKDTVETESKKVMDDAEKKVVETDSKKSAE